MKSVLKSRAWRNAPGRADRLRCLVGHRPAEPCGAPQQHPPPARGTTILVGRGYRSCGSRPLRGHGEFGIEPCSSGLPSLSSANSTQQPRMEQIWARGVPCWRGWPHRKAAGAPVPPQLLNPGAANHTRPWRKPAGIDRLGRPKAASDRLARVQPGPIGWLRVGGFGR